MLLTGEEYFAESLDRRMMEERKQGRRKLELTVRRRETGSYKESKEMPWPKIWLEGERGRE